MAIADNTDKTPADFRRELLALYQAPGVEAELLALQERYGASVPLILWGAWLRVRGQHLAALPAGVDALLAWEQATVWPLRQLRRQLKPQALTDPAVVPVREQVKTAEQAAEWLLLHRLAALPLTPGADCPQALVLTRYQAECEPLVALRAAISGRLNRPG